MFCYESVGDWSEAIADTLLVSRQSGVVPYISGGKGKVGAVGAGVHIATVEGAAYDIAKVRGKESFPVQRRVVHPTGILRVQLEVDVIPLVDPGCGVHVVVP